jgi:thymidine kinase
MYFNNETGKLTYELADYIEKIPTMCQCGSQAEFNCRKKDNVFVFSGEQIAIDGEGSISYQPLCGECYLKQKAKTQHLTSKNKHILKAEEKGK